MNPRCDICNRPVPLGTMPQYDLRGRPCLLACSSCNDQLVIERAQRLGVHNIKPLVTH